MNGVQYRKTEHRRGEHGENFGKIGREQELDRFPYIVVYSSAFLDRRNDRCEIVVGKHHVRDIFRHVRARYAHSDSDIRVFDRRSVVDAVAGHRGHFSERAPCVDDAHLMLRLNAGIDRKVLHALRKFFVGDPVEFRARYRL